MRRAVTAPESGQQAQQAALLRTCTARIHVVLVARHLHMHDRECAQTQSDDTCSGRSGSVH